MGLSSKKLNGDKMPKFGTRSENNLIDVHPDLIQICRFVIEAYDFTILCGYRGKAAQDAAYPKYTKVRYPNSKHNRISSEAIDIIPYDPVHHRIVPWDAYEEMAMLAGHMLMAAYAFDIKIRWGGDWNGDGNLRGETFNDRCHFELR